MRETRDLREMHEARTQTSLADLLSQLISQVEHLMAAHLRLLRRELATDGKKMIMQSAGLAGGAVLAILGVAFLGVAALNALATVIPDYWAAFVVALVFLLGGGLLAFLSLNRMSKIDPTNRTREETQETIAWLTRKR
jgi:hypothetical protein